MADMFQPDCGADNAMMEMVNHLSRKDGQPWQGPMQRDPRGRAVAGPGQLGPLGSQSGGEFFNDTGNALSNDLQRMQLQTRSRRQKQQRGNIPQLGSSNWADEFETHASGPRMNVQQHEMAQMQQAFVSTQQQHHNHHQQQHNPAAWAENFADMNNPIHHRNVPPPPQFGMPPPNMQDQRMFEQSWEVAQAKTHDWAADFLQYDETQQQQRTSGSDVGRLTAEQRELRATADELLRQANDPKFKDSEFMNFVKKIGSGEVTLEGNKVVEGDPKLSSVGPRSTDWASEFSEQDMTALPRTRPENWASEMAMNPNSWVDDFAQQQQQQHADGTPNQYFGDEFDQMEQAWNESSQKQSTADEWTNDFVAEEAISQSGYSFHPENPFLEQAVPHEVALENAQAALNGGALSQAILWAEAAVQKEPTRSDGWEMLGLFQAENEQEVLAILALRESARLEPGRSSAHLALAVSYTNELRFQDAYTALETALTSNPKYTGIPHVPMPEISSNRYLPLKDRHVKVQQLYLGAAQLNPDVVDADVQVGLGVLFNISNEYDKAVDCFTTALRSRPDDSALWNKLGATLANGNRAAEAVDAYARALELRPGYIRARYNLGISCINLKSYRDAAEHFLAGLNLQQLHSEDSTRRNMSETIWSSLRMALVMGQMDDLAELTRSRDIDKFRDHFEF